MPYKKDEDGKIVIGESGNPVFIFESGDEIELDFDKERQKIADLNQKVKNRGRRIESYENTIKMLNNAGIDTSDPDGVTNFINSLKAKASGGGKNKDLEERIKALETHNEKLQARVVKERKKRAFDKVRQSFSDSDFIKTKTSFVDPDVAYKFLKDDHVKLEERDGDFRPYLVNSHGDKVDDDGLPVSLDRAIEIVIKNHPKASKLLSLDGGGAGMSQSSHRRNQQPKVKTVDRTNRALVENLEDIASGKIVRE